jgi:bacterial/archaeal transporter family protein
MNAIIFAVIAALAAGLYSVLQRVTAPHVNQAFGALVISLMAAAISLAVLLATRDGRPLYADPGIFWWLALVGLAAFSVDYFSLHAYSRALPLSVGSPIFIGGSIMTATLAGLAMGESATLAKFLGIVLVIAGALVLSVFG